MSCQTSLMALNCNNFPTVGYGITLPTDEDAYVGVTKALEVGYRLINTSSDYENEKGMGKAVSASGLPRQELIIVSLDSNAKRSCEIPQSFNGYNSQLEQIYNSLESLSVDYIDYYMIHWPVPRYMEKVWRKLNADSWLAMEDCVKKGLIKHLGVSNFLPFHINELMKTAILPIEVNQLEIHPNFQQRETVQYCRNAGMKIMAFSPLFKGKSLALPEICRLAEKHGKTPAQIILRWNIQHNISPVVCSTNAERIASNFNIFDFEISDEDIGLIDNLETGEHIDYYSYIRQQESLKSIE